MSNLAPLPTWEALLPHHTPAAPRQLHALVAAGSRTAVGRARRWLRRVWIRHWTTHGDGFVDGVVMHVTGNVKLQQGFLAESEAH